MMEHLNITVMVMLCQEPFRKAGFGEADFHGVTTLHPLGIVAILVLGIACMALPRRRAAIPFIILACFVPAAQRLVVASLDFSLLRLLVLAAWVRILARQEYVGFRWTRVDVFVTSWSVAGLIAYVALRGTFGALVFRLGYAYDIIGMYFCFRCLVRDWADVDLIVRVAALIAIPIAAFFVVEKLTGRNHFSMLGGVPEMTHARQGSLRAQGPFPHAILAGAYFAAWIPIASALLWRRRSGLLGIASIGAMCAIVVMCSSSTPAGGVVAAFMGTVAWTVRRHMRAVRWSAVATLVALHLVMKAPVWHLISRVSFSKGSTSYHRFLLIDNAIKHVNEWFLIGSIDTSHWGHAMYDLTNHYVAEGVRGGILALTLFVLALFTAFDAVGRLWRSAGTTRYQQALAWGLGVSLFTHAFMFIGISIGHSQQNLVVFMLVLASISSLSSRNVPQANTRTRAPHATRRQRPTETGPLGDTAPA